MTEVTVSFDPASASMDAVQRAAYRLSDRMSCDFSASDDGLSVTIHSSDPEADLDELAGSLRNEVLDQVLRERVRAETGEVRNLVLALAFSRTGLIEGDE